MTVTDKQGGPRPLHALVGDDKLAAWSDEDKIKLEALEAELERDGPIAVERMREKDPGFFVQLAALLCTGRSPQGVGGYVDQRRAHRCRRSCYV